MTAGVISPSILSEDEEMDDEGTIGVIKKKF